MFPYPSGELHMGHVRVYTLADMLARYRRMKGQNVLFPMGWDAFGLPAENAARVHHIDPKTWTYQNIQHMKNQLKSLAIDFDWDRELATCDVNYYRHTQTLFKKLWETGFAYQKDAYVHWDPIDQTVLANEQVDALGRSWRSGALVEKKKLKQWFFKITHFAEDLLKGLDLLDWPSEVKQMQIQWIGKSQGHIIDFPLLLPWSTSTTSPSISSSCFKISTFTTKPETLLHTTFIAVSASHPCLQHVPFYLKSQVEDTSRLFLKEHLSPIVSKNEKKQPQGIYTGLQVRHPLTQCLLPVYMVNYVMHDYATGAVMGVPGQDPRDTLFAQQYPSLLTTNTTDALGSSHRSEAECYPNDNFLSLQKQLHEFLSTCSKTTFYKLKDWLISRQRKWGCPIPMLHCTSCGPIPSPTLVYQNMDTPSSLTPTQCPKCKQVTATYDPDTMDTFVDSSWYYLRFLDPQNDRTPFPSTSVVSSCMPVQLYVGGIEHAILHLLYARFMGRWIHQFIQPLPMEGEPFLTLLTQGMVHGKTYQHAHTLKYLKKNEINFSMTPLSTLQSNAPVLIKYEKMSKSKFNGVSPTSLLEEHGIDTLRAAILAKAPIAQVLRWEDRDLIGFKRWLTKVHGLVHARGSIPSKVAERFFGSAFQSDLADYLNTSTNEKELWVKCNEFKASITQSLETNHSLNTIPATLMKYTHTLLHHHPTASTFVYDSCLMDLLRLMAPITPCICQSLWLKLFPNNTYSSYLWQWPMHDPGTFTQEPPSHITVIVQLNGKKKGHFSLPYQQRTHLLDEVKRSKIWNASNKFNTVKDFKVIEQSQVTLVNCIT
ncbi:hypothetical protein HMI55_001465 [Coelomomyces lativittatus]|nr:hypothetical protein HMI55_001465 [Coelomomyces lativittatus]